MKLNEAAEILKLELITQSYDSEKEISGAYASDLLSDVIANTKKDNIWITLQTHVNIIAVAKLKELSAIIIVLNKEIDEDTLEKANDESITLLKTDLNAFLISGKLYELGIR